MSAVSTMGNRDALAEAVTPTGYLPYSKRTAGGLAALIYTDVLQMALAFLVPAVEVIFLFGVFRPRAGAGAALATCWVDMPSQRCVLSPC